MSEDVFSPESEAQDPELVRLGAAPGKDLSPAARRALEEAAARREAEAALALAPEKGGRDGPEPTRFGDWERKGVAVDF
ncbi:hypothetical protein AS593_06150 [Caulobacter vibrioides]|nr:hypothetical protein AS593_06150 [Caulobacter vibrioides]